MSLVQELTQMSADQLQRIHAAGKYTVYDSYSATYQRKDSFRAKNLYTPMQKSIIVYLNSVPYARSFDVAKNTNVKSSSIWGMLNTLTDRGKVFKKSVVLKGYKNPVMHYSTTKSNLDKLQDEAH